LSFFSADLTPPRVEDLAGLLAAHGQISVSSSGSRLSILLAAEWGARSLLREFRVRDVDAEYLPVAEAPAGGLLQPGDAANSGVLLRSVRTTGLDGLATACSRAGLAGALIVFGAAGRRCGSSGNDATPAWWSCCRRRLQGRRRQHFRCPDAETAGRPALPRNL